MKNQHAYPEKNHSLWLSHTYLPTDAYTNLQGINFTNCNLRQVDFTNSLLGNNNFSHAQLNNANFQGMNLRHCAFIHANLHGTQFQACDLSHCLMQHADLTHANLQHATVITSNLTHAIMTNVNARHADFTRAKFTDALCNSADFSDATMVRSVIDNAIFDRASLKSANLEHARFYAASFKYADLTQANLAYSFGTCPDFSRANMDSANLQHADFSYAAKQGRLIHTNLNNADLRHANLDKVEADGISLVNAKLDHTKIHLLIKMEHPQFFDALLLNPDLLDAYLTQLNNMIITMAASEREETRIAIAKSLGSHLAELPEQQSQANLELAWQHALLRDAEHNQLATVANSGLALLRYTASFFYKQPPHQAGDDFMKTPAQEALLRQATRRG